LESRKLKFISVFYLLLLALFFVLSGNGCSRPQQLFAEHPDFFARRCQLDIQPNRGGRKRLRPISKLG
jgi:hypothetical protein